MGDVETLMSGFRERPQADFTWGAVVLPVGPQLTAERVSELREQARHTYIYVGLRVSSIEDGT